MHLIFISIFLMAALKWGDWKRWRDYYPTILFLITGDLLYNFLFFNHSMWAYQETIFLEDILTKHTIISLMIMFIVYPSTVLIYLGKFPHEQGKQILWIMFWILIYVVVEFINSRFLHLINHQNGWNNWWSLAFNVVMFVMLRVHHKNPLIAWGLSLLWILFLWNMFKIPFEILK
ncbi:CBO0543 family protein [Alkalihalobacillus sp. AL-G]|uniref:CBO0543 family protein n=1 Tax=Alkalihalobacillus sp. AL-G TaxID=2926399 RepID=UPI00272BC5B5|nr:CBO0543 family protein [Alkalihalobacillus sp. AL-G]WLD91623.1 hypothetical protein MOJ78_11250 [Alkalihalobacillus sp. AL-G]